MALQIVWTPESKLQLNEILKYWELRNDSLLYSKICIKVKIIKGYYLFYSFDMEKLSVIGFCDMRRDPNFVESIIIKKI